MAGEQTLLLDPAAMDSQVEVVDHPVRCRLPCRGLNLSAGLLAAGLLAAGVVAALTKASHRDAASKSTSELIGLRGKQESTCGSKEDIEETTCAAEGSVVREQGRAVAKMYIGGGVCTAWLVKAETSSKGALMMTTGHCAKNGNSEFAFDYVNDCGGGGNPSSHKRCKGVRVHAKVSEDEEALYELERPCAVVNGRIPIKLDVGLPEKGEGVYLIGHPNGRPQYLSHEEAHDGGKHCRLTKVNSPGSRRRQNAYYWCDTQGGNSGGPVFSARTGFAFAIHKWGGCRSHDDDNSGNGGTLLQQTTITEALVKFGIPFVDRSKTNLMYQGIFEPEGSCQASDNVVRGVDLEECKELCLNSLSCTAIAHSASRKQCSITAVRGTKARSCLSDSKYFTLRSRSLYRAPHGSTPPSSGDGVCKNTCVYANDNECDDGGLNSAYDMCELGSDCGDCGPRKACDETYKSSDKGASYRGCQTKTKTGKKCQRWDSQSPHQHSRQPSKYPQAGLEGNNYCRNPDGHSTIWCYTTDPEKRWDNCVPLVD